MFKLLTTLLLLSAFSCNKKEKNQIPKEANLICNGYYAIGSIEYDTYIFCSTVPIEQKYYYKKGEWKYWNQEGRLIAEGTYKSESIKIEDHGGCPYEITVGKIKREKWKFRSTNGDAIISSDKLIEELEDCNITWIK